MASIYCACFAAAASARHSSSRPAILLNCDSIIHHSVQTHRFDRLFNSIIIQSKRIGLTDYSTLPNR
ncbi:hypothetical protein PR003_g21271 [Phytophthora rubi]|uniref:Uncharacterized protein n=1 Tax=Phytophthora rubi TaxID=129364 RepID=A0A6A3KTI5_9STRA|nr:hypothetical protein PR002_g16616 [Phytophthora rubi]KAE9010169.1 hypothetical protein PR001_g16248 [Phytophthora rubi]KAE9306318.1 hypothetical protein PR003_g21271 [Phytophthora rubi]